MRAEVRPTKRVFVTSVIDLLIVSAMFVVCGIINHGPIIPFQRIIFCKDDSITFPYKDSTVPFWMVIVVGAAAELVQILVVETVHALKTSDKAINIKWTFTRNMWRLIIFFLLGAAITELFTATGKVMAGIQRPNFKSVCQPSSLVCDDTETYFTAQNCTGNIKDIYQSQKSFPSGHTSASVYMATIGILYLQYRLSQSTPLLMLPGFLQCVWGLLAAYVGLSRLSDYKHHWSDVLAGALLGSLVALLTFYYLGELHNLDPVPQSYGIKQNVETTENTVQTNGDDSNMATRQGEQNPMPV